MKKSIIAALAILTLASCAKTDEATTITTDSEVRICSSIATRTVGNSWSNDDKIGIYMSTNVALNYDFGDLYENVPYVTTTTNTLGNFTPYASTTLYYPATDNVDLLAYYPYNDAADFDATAYPVNVATQTTQGAIDLMVAKVTDQAKTTKAVDLEFDHKLSNIVLNVVNGDGYDKLGDIGKISKIELSGSVTTADFDLTDDAISLGSEVKPIEFVVSQSDEAITAEAIIIPQTLSGSSAIISVTTEAGAVHTVALNGIFGVGTQYSYELKLSLTELNISGATIHNWNEKSGGELEGTVPDYYAVGDLYPNETDPIGVVCLLTDDTDGDGYSIYGKVVSLDEYGPTAWDTSNSTTNVSGFSQSGLKVMDQLFTNYADVMSTRFTGFYWAHEKNIALYGDEFSSDTYSNYSAKEVWYIPTTYDVTLMLDNIAVVNSTLADCGTQIGSSSYWTCVISSSHFGYKYNISSGVTTAAYSLSGKHYFRAMFDF